MPSITLQGKLIISGKIEAVTGLHIGGAAAGLDIGGIDNPIIRHPITRQPYVPGSSLRGKMRSWLDRHYGKELNKFIRRPFPQVRVHECEREDEYTDCVVCQLFGVSPGEHKDFSRIMPTRLIVRDAHLLVGDKSERGSTGWLESAKTDLPYTEVKWEATIDRITSAAVPRQNERVPAGAIFEPLEIIVSMYDAAETKFVPSVFKALQLLEDDYLGGYGSRGAGKIRFRDLRIVFKSRKHYEENATPHIIGEKMSLADVKVENCSEMIKDIIEKQT